MKLIKYLYHVLMIKDFHKDCIKYSDKKKKKNEKKKKINK